MKAILSIFNYRNRWLLTTTKIASRFLELTSKKDFYILDNVKINNETNEILGNIYHKNYQKQLKTKIENLTIEEVLSKVDVLLVREPLSRCYSGFLQNIQSDYFEFRNNYLKLDFDKIDGMFMNFDFKDIDMDIFLNPIKGLGGISIYNNFFDKNEINELWHDEFQKFIIEYIKYLIKNNIFTDYMLNDIHTTLYLCLYDLINQNYGPFEVKDIHTSNVIKTYKEFDTLKYFKGYSQKYFEESINNIEIYQQEITLYNKLINN